MDTDSSIVWSVEEVGHGWSVWEKWTRNRGTTSDEFVAERTRLQPVIARDFYAASLESRSTSSFSKVAFLGYSVETR